MGEVKISSLELENVKRVRALSLEPSEDGLTVIGGRNAQGKTSVLDAIAWALGGDRKRPVNPNRDGAANPAHLRVELSNGVVVERRGKNGALHVTDESGKKAGQALLNEFVGQLALDLPRFLNATDAERADYLLGILGIGKELDELDHAVKAKYDERLGVGRMRDRKAKAAQEMERYDDAPEEPVSVADLVREQQAILAKNGENQRKREMVDQIRERMVAKNGEVNAIDSTIKELEERIGNERRRLVRTVKERDALMDDLETAKKTAEQLVDESTAEIEASIAGIEATNAKVAANARWAEASAEAAKLAQEYDALTGEIEDLRNRRVRLLDGADMPLEGLGVDQGVLTFDGQVWSDMSSAEQMRVATAIVRATKPGCGFVLVDKLEQLDPVQLAEFAAWCEGEGLQVIGTRVAVDDTCTVVIEDGRIVGQDMDETPAPDPRGEALPSWGGEAF